MSPTVNSPCRSEPKQIDRTFVDAVRQMFESAPTLERLETLGRHLKDDPLASNEEKRLLRADYIRVREVLAKIDDAEVADEQGATVLRER